MIRFEKKEHLKILIFISDLIRKVFGGDRTKRISKKIELILKKEAGFKKKFQLWILDVDQWKYLKKSSIINL